MSSSTSTSAGGGPQNDDDDYDYEMPPQSVEEAGALLGAAITRCDSNSSSVMQTILPPAGMHSSFATLSPVPSSELFARLHSLRALLRSAPQNQPLIAAPSLLAVLMKLLRLSSSLATTLLSSSSSSASTASRIATPPMLSTPLRQLWVDCVVLCHTLGDGLSGKARIDLFAFLRNIMALAGTNPKSSKAAGGTRLAALGVTAGLLQSPPLQTKLAPWALDVMILCHKGLKSSGSGEPTHRLLAVRTASAMARACREAFVRTHPDIYDNQVLLLSGAIMEDKAIVETCKLIKHATFDKFPEVRSSAARLLCIMAPMLLHLSLASSQQQQQPQDANTSITGSLEECLVLAMKNVNDEMAGVAVAWAEALARCVCSCIQYGSMLAANSSSRRRSGSGDGTPEGEATSSRFGGTRSGGKALVVQQCSTLPAAIAYLVDHFVKVGGELAASRGGGPFSMGGRASRIGISLALTKMLQLQSQCGNIGPGQLLSTEQVIAAVLHMVGPDLEKQVQTTLDSVSSSSSFGIDAPAPTASSSDTKTSLFGSGRTKSHADAGLARQATNRVLRQGLVEMASEPVQLAILKELIAVCSLNDRETSKEEQGEQALNGHQLQVVLIEVSHLVTTLGEAATSCLADLVPALQACLVHPTHGVRHEAAIACAALAGPFPSTARKLLRSSIDDIQLNHAELVKLANSEDGAVDESSPASRRRRFGRVQTKPVHPSLVHQYAIHGHCLMVSILIRELPHLPGGLPSSLLMSGLSVAEILVNCQYSTIMMKSNPAAACTCVRAGYSILCGSLTMGAESITPYISLIFGLWQKIGKQVENQNQNLTQEHEIVCLDAAVSSIVAFLKHCPELLLSVPDALSRTTLLLEQLLPLVLPEGRLGVATSNPIAISSHDALKASLMEAFAWLPPGSFPMIADQVFAMAARHIRSGTEAEVTCSLLPSLLNNEDEILDAKSLDRAQRYGQVGGARDIDENLIALVSEAAHHGERESVLHFETGKVNRKASRHCHKLRGSELLGMFAHDGDRRPAPTPLHEVGTWREPASPSCSSKVRLVDAAVQSFSATFGLKDGKEQHTAMLMLESLVPPFLAQLARAIGVNTALTEPERRAKAKDDNAAIANITAVLLACLQALPLHEATHDIPIGLGPPWMNKAKDLLLTLLPSASNIVRRAAAEGLALLATLGVTEDAHTLQSTVLHSLDEVMQGNQPDGKPRPLPLLEPVSAARAGSLLTLACIQRTAHRIKEEHRARARGRASNTEAATDTQSDALPTIQMMTRILPSLACHGMRDAFRVRTYAMHSFGLLIAYSQQNNAPLSDENTHLLKKAVEVVEDNFLAAWTAVSADFDRGQESEKLSAEASFLSVLLRLMTFLVPTLRSLSDRSHIAERFSTMATVIMESYGNHPVVFMESLAFFERLSAFQSMLPPYQPSLIPSENSLNSAIPFIFQGISPDRPLLLADDNWASCRGSLGSVRGLRIAVRCLRLLSLAGVPFSADRSLDCASAMSALLEVTAGRRIFASETAHRSLAVPRQVDVTDNDVVTLERETMQTLDTLLLLESRGGKDSNQSMLDWILLSKTLLIGRSDGTADGDRIDPRSEAVSAARRRAEVSASRVFQIVGQCRWQVKCQATRSGAAALEALSIGVDLEKSPNFNPAVAERKFQELCRNMDAAEPDNGDVLPTFLVFHLAEVLGSACSAAVATLDQSELRLLQTGGVRFLSKLVACFGDIPDTDDAGQKILDQFSSQIQSSVKHSLSVIDDEDEEASYGLFIFGCKALQNAVTMSLIADPTALKRLLRPILPSKDEIPFFEYESDRQTKTSGLLQKEASFSNQRQILLPRIGKLWTLGKLRELLDNGFVPAEAAAPMLEGVGACRCEIAIHSAALALDACRLLRGANLTLAGMPVSDEPKHEISSRHGLLYETLQDIDDMTKATLVDAWPSCACNAMVNLLEAISSESIDEDRRSACLTWTEKLVPAVLTGFHDGVRALKSATVQHSSVGWARDLETEEVVIMCLHSIRVLFSKASDAVKMPRIEELDRVVSSLSHSILLPIITATAEEDEGPQEKPAATPEETVITRSDVLASTELVTESCKFLETIARTEWVDADALETAMLQAVLQPLNAWQTGNLDFERKHAIQVVTSSASAVCSIIRRPNAKESVIMAILQLSMDMLSKGTEIPEELRTTAELMLCECLAHDAVPPALQKGLAQEMARDNKWKAWATVCSQSQVALSHSIPAARAALSDFQNPTIHLAALAAVRHVVQGASAPWIAAVMNGLGAQVLALLEAYGTLTSIQEENMHSHRTLAFADAMKILMLAYPTIDNDSSVADFLSVVFEVLTAVIAYNGLPNQASPQPSADPALGRLSAQAIVHVARTTPAPFKESMATLTDHGRALLEFAVRAEMSGYASTNAPAPAKKKLNVAGFKKQ